MTDDCERIQIFSLFSPVKVNHRGHLMSNPEKNCKIFKVNTPNFSKIQLQFMDILLQYITYIQFRSNAIISALLKIFRFSSCCNILF